MKRTIISLALLLLLLVLAQATLAQSGGTFELSWSTADDGGGTCSGGDFSLFGTAGQPAASDELSGGTFTLEGGFSNGGTGGATAVTLVSFTATAVGRVLFQWETAIAIFVIACGVVVVWALRRRWFRTWGDFW